MAEFITSGNIDRYRIRPGQVRFLNRLYERPLLPLDVPELTAAKRQLFRGTKIVIAGLSRRLEAAWDQRGLALGVQVFAASGWRVDPFYLLALLNSKLLSFLFATRFAAKRLAGGYLAINKGQLTRLPVRAVAASARSDARRRQRLSELAAAWSRTSTGHEAAGLPGESEADQLVYQLYRLNDAEIDRVEELVPPGRRRLSGAARL
jgi:hypothetical protein